MIFPIQDIHPDMGELMAAKKALPQSEDKATMRSGWADYAAALQRDYPEGMSVSDTVFNCPGAGTEGTIAVRIYRPSATPAQSPCIVYIHGGAFIKGSLDSGDPIAWGIADQTDCVVVSLDYRLAPEHPFPAALEDCYAALSHLAEHGTAHGINSTRLAVWGDSAGGNLAAAVCLMARDRRGPRISAQALNYACLTDELTADSYARYADAPVTTASIDRAWNLYLGDRRPTNDPYAAPLKATSLEDLPPAHIHLAEFDCLADDSRAFAERLSQAGNRVVLRTAPRMIHGYLRARFSGPDAAEEFAAPCRFLRQILFAGSSDDGQRSRRTA